MFCFVLDAVGMHSQVFCNVLFTQSAQDSFVQLHCVLWDACTCEHTVFSTFKEFQCFCLRNVVWEYTCGTPKTCDIAALECTNAMTTYAGTALQTVFASAPATNGFLLDF